MDKRILSNLTKNYEVELIEKHLIHSFLQKNKLEFKNSPIISKVLKKFTADANICQIISSLKIDDLKTLENHLELLIPKTDRKLNGAFFTPSYIVDFIINEVAPRYGDKCLDLSCGCGAFLIGLVEYYQRTFQKSIRRIVRENIFGSDILDYNVNRAKTILSIYGLLNGEFLEDKDFNIYCQDSLKTDWKSRFEIIVGNPPYVKYQDLSDENRTYLINHWETIKAGAFNLYFAFFELGHKLLTLNGKLGYITPNNYFTSLAGLSLRKYFSQNKCLTRILDFKHKKVFDAQTYTAITFFNKKKNNSLLFDRIKEAQRCEEFLISANGSPNYIKNLNVKKWRLLKNTEQENIKIIEAIGVPINRLFNIAVGIATLKDTVFFVDTTNENNDYLIKKTRNGTFLIEKEITKPVYKISQFKTQNGIEKNTLRIITPYYTELKSSLPINEEEFKRKYPKCFEYLLSEKDNLKNRDKGRNSYTPFYSWGRTQGITRFGKKILNPTFSKYPRFLFVSETDAYYTNGYGIYFKQNGFFSSFGSSVHPMSKEKNVLEVQKILNSVIMDYYIKTTSVSLQGGFFCYQKNFIEKFTIPNFSEEELNILKGLSCKSEINEFLVEKYQVDIQQPSPSYPVS